MEYKYEYYVVEVIEDYVSPYGRYGLKKWRQCRFDSNELLKDEEIQDKALELLGELRGKALNYTEIHLGERYQRRSIIKLRDGLVDAAQSN